MSRRSSSESLLKPRPSTSKQPKRLFSEKDEIDLLKSVLNSAENPFPSGNFSSTQISDKIRRLKQKYHKLAGSKSSIKTPHDRKLYEIARKIWGNEKTGKPMGSPTPMEEERKDEGSEGSKEIAINWNDFPFLMKHVSRAFPGSMQVYKEGLKGLGEDILKGLDEKWMVLEMEEAAIDAKRDQMNYNYLKSILEAKNKDM